MDNNFQNVTWYSAFDSNYVQFVICTSTFSTNYNFKPNYNIKFIKNKSTGKYKFVEYCIEYKMLLSDQTSCIKCIPHTNRL